MSTFFFRMAANVTPIERVTLADGTTQIDQPHSVLDRNLSASKDDYFSTTTSTKHKSSAAYSLTDSLATSFATIIASGALLYTTFIRLNKKATPGADPTLQISLDGGATYPFYLNGDGAWTLLPLVTVTEANLVIKGTNATVDILTATGMV